MATVTDLTLCKALGQWGPLSSLEAWRHLEQEYPAVWEWLCDNLDDVGEIGGEFVRLIVLVLEAFVNPDQQGDATFGPALRQAIERQYQRQATRPRLSLVPARLTAEEPELAALLAFFLRETQRRATNEHLCNCCLLYASVVLALSASPIGQTVTPVDRSVGPYPISANFSRAARESAYA